LKQQPLEHLWSKQQWQDVALGVRFQSMDVMEFFQQSTGRWRSQRTTHHLAFRRAEDGESEIRVEALPADHSKVVEICHLHQVDPAQAIGGAFVSWRGAMGWDKEDDNHEGSTVFALIPDATEPHRGTLLRERGYAEIVPVAGQYHMDEEGALVLTTEYETMSSIERFWFPSPSLRMRTSTVKRFGGFSTATFCTEFRMADSSEAPAHADQSDQLGQSDQSDQSDQSQPDLTSSKVTPVESTQYSLLGW
jgi:CpeS-like protein